ncbi:MAG: tRNA(Ile)(2)-agmatinylcytidine synthase [Candidatus Bathyarchaeota archaeon]|nr:tRNA(Ile)(2)-agmatinylcytidine synthase [Candidatus Bathyarchaeota archaeon]
MRMNLHIGFDDTDSPRTGCTTYVAALLVEKMRKLGASFIDYPGLIRLNPNVPWKTRGNGALCLRILCEEHLLEEAKETVIEAVEEHADLSCGRTDPGVVFLTGEVPSEIEAFAQKTISGLVRKNEALGLIKKVKAEAVGFKKGRGIIGGLAAIGERLKGDHTYEFIAYRKPENRGTLRRVDASSVIWMDRQMGRLTFNNVDSETGRILITPRGPDPILYGIRGETAKVVKHGHELVLSDEPIERWVVFRTNQGTDAHLKRAVSISEVKPYNPVIIRGEVVEKPRVIQGGHVIFQIKDGTSRVDCAAYEPTGNLRDVAGMLMTGDLIEVHGGVRTASSRNPVTVNLEKIRVMKLAPLLVLKNPACPVCGKRTKSMGKGQGFECRKCGYHGPNLKKTVLETERPIKPGLYVTSPRSQRHLTKPLKRYGLEKTGWSQCLEGIIPYELFYGH